MRALVSCALLLAFLAASALAQGYIKPAKRLEHVTSPQPHEYMANLQALPANFSWTNVNGANYLTEVRNQHLPQYCGSCWAFAATSVVSDRIKIMRYNAWPEVNLAPQVLLNCGNAGKCTGGDSSAAYAYMHTSGITDETCAPYMANSSYPCTPINICKTCQPDFSNPARKCSAQTPQKIWKVSQYGTVSGETNMMAEIYARGPISCSMAVTQEFVNYSGGIFTGTTNATTPDHEISLIGWGVDANNTPYWIGRNLWGTFWGENGGLFRIIRGKNALLIESDCSWAVPIVN